MFTDTANNFMGLYSQPPGGHGEMPPKGDGPPVVHFEVGGSDVETLESFYTQMFGWKINFIEQANYRMIEQEADGIGGGMFEHVEGMPRTRHPSQSELAISRRISTRLSAWAEPPSCSRWIFPADSARWRSSTTSRATA